MPKLNPLHDIPNLVGKVCLVTGGSSGLGEATVKALAQHTTDKVYLAARSMSKAKAALLRIKESSPAARSANIDILDMDLASFDSIKAATARINKGVCRLDIVYLNAGVAMIPPAVTENGYEVQFGTNYMGHALLTQLLMPKLLQTASLPGADVRVISISTTAHKTFVPKEGIVFDGLHTPMEKIGGPALYGQAGLAKILVTRQLAKLYPQTKFTSVHPGGVKSDIYSGAKDMNWVLYNCIVKPLVALRGVTPDEGAKTQLWCSFSKDVVNGSYYEPIGELDQESNLAKDTVLVAKLWGWTEKELLAKGAPGWPQA